MWRSNDLAKLCKWKVAGFLHFCGAELSRTENGRGPFLYKQLMYAKFKGLPNGGCSDGDLRNRPRSPDITNCIFSPGQFECMRMRRNDGILGSGRDDVGDPARVNVISCTVGLRFEGGRILRMDG